MLFRTILLSLFMFSSALAADNASYQEEYMFLQQQLKSLQKRKSKSLSELKKMESGLQKKVLSLGGSVSYLENNNEVLRTKLSKFDQNRSDKDFSVKKTEVVFSQMKEFAAKKNLVKNSEDLNIDELNALILEYLAKGAVLNKTNGQVYNKAGEKVDGEIYSIGHVASYFSKNDKLALLSSGQNGEGLFLNGLEIPKESLLVSGQMTRPLTVSLREGEMLKPKTFSSVLNAKLKAGGAVGYIIILLGFIGLGVACVRYSLISRYSSNNEVQIKEVVQQIQQGNLDSAKKLLNSQKMTPLTKFVDILISSKNKSDEVYEAIVIDEISKIQSKVSKYGPYLMVLAAVAPLLGLLGTVTGMIGTFDMITLYGTGNPKLLSGGIKEALVTTQMGLVVAIPCILAGNYLSSKAIKIVNKFEEVASTLPRI